MKFLTFNIVVAAALGYLLLGDRPEVQNNNVVAKLTASVDQAWSKARETATATKEILSEQKPDKANASPAAKPAVPVPEQKPTMVRRAPAPKGQEVEVASVTDVTPATAEQINSQKAEQVAANDPAAARRRAEILGAPVPSKETSVGESNKPAFMTPGERRRELLRLAEDMELQFLDTVKQ